MEYKKIIDITDENTHLDINFEEYKEAKDFILQALNFNPSHIYIQTREGRVEVSVDKKTYEKLVDGIHLGIKNNFINPKSTV